MKLDLGLLGVVVIGLSLGLPVQAANFTFTKIADDSSGPLGPRGDSPPSINNAGVLAFKAYTDNQGNEGIFTSDGTTTTTIADSYGPFESFLGGEGSTPSINDKGTVAFSAALDSGRDGIFTSDGTTTTTVIDSSSPLYYFSNPSINNTGTVAFRAFTDDGGEGIFTSDGKTITTIADTDGSFESFTYGAPSPINDKGIVAFGAVLDSGESGLFTSDGTTTTTIADSSYFTDPSINNKGIVAFSSIPDTGDSSIITSDGTTTTTVADTSGPFAILLDVSINNKGRVAFTAIPDGGVGMDSSEVGIFTGPDIVADKVIATGDLRFGSKVSYLNISPEGLNDAGQIAFYAESGDISPYFKSGIYRAVPEPGSGIGLLAAVAIFGTVRYGWCHLKRFHKVS